MMDKDDTRWTTDEGRRTTPGVWHKLPTGELIIGGLHNSWKTLKKSSDAAKKVCDYFYT